MQVTANIENQGLVSSPTYCDYFNAINNWDCCCFNFPLVSLVFPIMNQIFLSPSQLLKCNDDNGPGYDYSTNKLLAIIGLAHAALSFMVTGCCLIGSCGEKPLKKNKYLGVAACYATVTLVSAIWDTVILAKTWESC